MEVDNRQGKKWAGHTGLASHTRKPITGHGNRKGVNGEKQGVARDYAKRQVILIPSP